MIDDSSLFHGKYDPVKAREYYLRTRKLKGRRPTSATVSDPGRGGRRQSKGGAGSGKPNRADTKSRRAELQAQKVALEKRLDRLREVLAQRVKEAKALSEKNAPKHKKVGKGSSSEKSSGIAPETKTDTADRNADQKAKRLTGSQKATKAKKAKEAYEKEHPTSLSEDVEILQEQVKQIREKIQNAISDASRARQKQAGKKDAQIVRPQAKSQPKSGS